MLVALAFFAILLAGSSTAQGASLAERTLPFDLPWTNPFPDAILGDAVAGSNGTAHMFVWTGGGLFYVWIDAETGEALESVNLSARGFQLPATSPSGRPDPQNIRFVRLAEHEGTVAVVVPYGAVALDVMMFTQGQASAANPSRVLLPPSVNSSLRQFITGLDMATRDAGNGRFTVAWAREYYGWPYDLPLTEFGSIDLDLASRSWSVNRSLSYARGLHISIPSAAEYHLYGAWGVIHDGDSMAAAFDADGMLWYFMVAQDCVALPYYGDCGPGAGTKMVVTHAARNETHELVALDDWPIFASVDAIQSPEDGSAAGAYVLVGPNQTTLAWVGARGNAASIWTTNQSVNDVTGLSAFTAASASCFLVSEVRNTTATVESRFLQACGFPGAPTVTEAGRGSLLVERPRLVGTGPALRMVAGALLDSVNATAESPMDSLSNLSVGRAWPTIVSILATGSTFVATSGWQAPVEAPVVDLDFVTLPSGEQMGVATLRENGTGRARLLTPGGPGGQFTLSEPLSIWGDAVNARLVAYGSGALVVVLAYFPHPDRYSGGLYAYPTAFVYVVVDESGNPGRAVVVPPAPGYASYAKSYDEWRLSSLGGDPLVAYRGGVLVLDPTNSSYRRPLLMLQTPDNWTQFYDPAAESVMPRGFPGQRCRSNFVGSYFSCDDVSEWWIERDQLMGAFVVYGTSDECYQAGTCTPAIRVVTWRDGRALAVAQVALVTGAANDTVLTGLEGDLRAVRSDTGTINFAVTARNVGFWSRLFSVSFDPGTSLLGEPALRWEEMDLGASHAFSSLEWAGDGWLQLMAPRDGSSILGEPTQVTARRVADGRAVDYRFGNVNWSCPYVQVDMVDWGGYAYPPCPVWSVLTWNGDVGMLFLDAGRPRFFANNSPPTPPRLISPPNDTVAETGRVSLEWTASEDADGDPLVYECTVRSRGYSGMVVPLLSTGPRASVDLPDGSYEWTCSVSDGNEVVPSPDRFVFFVRRESVESPTNATGDFWVDSVGATWVRLRWEPVEQSTFSYYQVTVRLQDGNRTPLQVLDVDNQSAVGWVVIGLTPATAYEFQWEVVDAAGRRGDPLWAVARTAPGSETTPPPPAPTPDDTRPPTVSDPGQDESQSGGQSPAGDGAPSTTLGVDAGTIPIIVLGIVLLCAMAMAFIAFRRRSGRQPDE